VCRSCPGWPCFGLPASDALAGSYLAFVALRPRTDARHLAALTLDRSRTPDTARYAVDAGSTASEESRGDEQIRLAAMAGPALHDQYTTPA
jgi:hypothetical protein